MRYSKFIRAEQLIGEGGFGKVYKGFHELLQIPVAIKVMKRHQDGADSQKRFVREARLLARLDHPNVVRVFELGKQEQDLFMVLEWMPGGTLESVDNEEQLLTVAETVARAMQAFEQAGIIHRDIKPQNILVKEDTSTLKLADLGIAFEDPMTMEGHLIGSVAYMASELFEADQPLYTQSSDIWSLGSRTLNCGPAKNLSKERTSGR